MKKTLAISLVSLVSLVVAFGSFSIADAGVPSSPKEALSKLKSSPLVVPDAFKMLGSYCSPQFKLDKVSNLARPHIDSMLMLIRMACIGGNINLKVEFMLKEGFPPQLVTKFSNAVGDSFAINKITVEGEKITVDINIDPSKHTVAEDIVTFVKKVAQESETENGFPLAHWVDGTTTSKNQVDDTYVINTLLPMATVSGAAAKVLGN